MAEKTINLKKGETLSAMRKFNADKLGYTVVPYTEPASSPEKGLPDTAETYDNANKNLADMASGKLSTTLSAKRQTTPNAMQQWTANKLGIDVNKPATPAGMTSEQQALAGGTQEKFNAPSGSPVVPEVEQTAFGNIGETDPNKRYIKYSNGNEVFDKKTMTHVSEEQAKGIPDFWNQVDYSEMVPEQLTNKETEQAGTYGQDPSKIFVKFADSMHVFNKSTGEYMSADHAAMTENFWENTEFSEDMKPPELIKPLKAPETDLTENINEEINDF